MLETIKTQVRPCSIPATSSSQLLAISSCLPSTQNQIFFRLLVSIYILFSWNKTPEKFIQYSNWTEAINKPQGNGHQILLLKFPNKTLVMVPALIFNWTLFPLQLL
jgi:hypothetical protein